MMCLLLLLFLSATLRWLSMCSKHRNITEKGKKKKREVEIFSFYVRFYVTIYVCFYVCRCFSTDNLVNLLCTSENGCAIYSFMTWCCMMCDSKSITHRVIEVYNTHSMGVKSKLLHRTGKVYNFFFGVQCYLRKYVFGYTYVINIQHYIYRCMAKVKHCRCETYFIGKKNWWQKKIATQVHRENNVPTFVIAWMSVNSVAH